MTAKVFYDGLCQVCSREITHYRRQKGADRIEFIDITAEDFDAGREGLDPHAVHRAMHLKLEDGTVRKGVDAFIEIWRRLPRYRKLVNIAEIKVIRLVLELGYRAFARVRPLLPRRKGRCADSPYCDL